VDKWLLNAKDQKIRAIESGASQVFIQPILKGKPAVLHYYKFRLKGLDGVSEETCRRSGVLDDIRGKWLDWGTFKPLNLYVHGVVVKAHKVTSKGKEIEVKRFIALRVMRESGQAYHNQLLTLNLLHCRGFITPLPYCSWIAVNDVYRSNLCERLDHINRVMKDSLPIKWPPATGLELFNFLGRKP